MAKGLGRGKTDNGQRAKKAGKDAGISTSGTASKKLAKSSSVKVTYVRGPASNVYVFG